MINDKKIAKPNWIIDLLKYPLNIREEDIEIDGTPKKHLVIQNEKEVLGIILGDTSQLVVSYLSLDQEISKITLHGCPAEIKSWEEQLDKSYSNQVPYFSLKLDSKLAQKISEYLAQSMCLNKEISRREKIYPN
ncbi:MAG: hypothetical protein PHD81_00230 [Candidatus Nanoarchaeia archaeon]|nr:hypothetical protein [Candidatus Nanoarchaeia archaeon]MDD5587518.1 hypothetical protein [Candidatus Nanoarchaeia archaeon]